MRFVAKADLYLLSVAIQLDVYGPHDRGELANAIPLRVLGK